MITLYGCYRSRASRNIWLMEEAGTPFTLAPVMQPDRTVPPGGWTTRSPEFLALNPAGQIPFMTDGATQTAIGESIAINHYLAAHHCKALGPRTPAEEAQTLQWSFWAVTAAEPHTIQVLYHIMGNPYGPKEPAKAALAVEALRKPFALLDAHLAKTGFMVGGRFTAADINVAEIVRYASPAPELFEAAPHVGAWLKACHARPAFKAMWAKRDQEPV